MAAKERALRYILIIFLVILASAAILIIYLLNNPEILENPDPVSPDIRTQTDLEIEPDSLRRLKIDNIFWTKRLELAGDKSIDLLLDLYTKEVIIEIQGVTVFRAPILYSDYNDTLMAMCHSEMLEHWLAEPFRLTDESASIAKEPIQVRDIRPGSSEFDDHLIRFRDPEKENEVIIYLYFSNQLTLCIRQIEYMPESGESHRLSNLKPKHQLPYYLEIFIDQEAAKTIYRAVSVDETGLALRPE